MRIELYKYVLLLALCVLGVRFSYAQDPQLTQAYAAPTYLNPAFTGLGIGNRFIVNFREQWPNTPANYLTGFFTYDRHLQGYNSGAGIMAMVDRAGRGNLRNSTITGLYAYQLSLRQNRMIVRAGLNFSFTSVSVDYDKLTFGDQITIDGKVFDATTDAQDFRRKNYFSFTPGIMAYNKNIWGGVTIRHLNRPNQALLGTISQLPMVLSVHGGMKINLNLDHRIDREIDLLPTFHYKAQTKYDQLDIGLYFYYQPMIFAMWYRGIPVKHYEIGIPNNDALSVIFGYKQNDFRITYSYDMTVSGLAGTTGGAHEVAIMYEYKHKRKRKKKNNKPLPCPAVVL